MTAANRAVWQSFADAWAAKDIDAVMGHFTDDIVYHNIPMEAAEGTDAVRGVIEGFFGMAETILFETVHEVSEGDLLMNERVDTFTTGGNDTAIKVMGVVEFEDGKIARWRDYFDMAGLTGG